MDPNAPAVVVLRPGDRVLLAMTHDPEPDEAQAWMQALAQDFPGIKFTICGGVAGIAVQSGKEPSS